MTEVYLVQAFLALIVEHVASGVGCVYCSSGASSQGEWVCESVLGSSHSRLLQPSKLVLESETIFLEALALGAV